MIRYQEGYKYQLYEDYQVPVLIKPAAFIMEPFIRLDVDGMLSLRAGYAWDGPSGPTIDTKNFMRGSLVHDALYQLMRHGKLDSTLFREIADGELVRLCKEDGMSAIRASWVYAGVRFGGGPHAAKTDDVVLTAP